MNQSELVTYCRRRINDLEGLKHDIAAKHPNVNFDILSGKQLVFEEIINFVEEGSE